ncbi:hypothetical protein Klosneuvirus_7_13 [Klosneuvirus KNV1]|uniref:Beta-propeller repeat protein n=1 Tax=Klosneuvirus KNV1 TaxID=1977640 RepID=A0A1V0SLR8_9VIRU|nr:hypothetical protein Klosneuvirus_7_13 [Klosneuvirus KNV1]
MCSTTFGTHQITLIGTSDMIIAKLDTDGNWLWVEQVGYSGANVNGNAITIDTKNDIYISGTSNNSLSLTFGRNTITSSNGNYLMFIGKLSYQGEWIFGRLASANNFISTSAIDVNSQGDIYTIGNTVHPTYFNTDVDPAYAITLNQAPNDNTTSHTFVSKMTDDELMNVVGISKVNAVPGDYITPEFGGVFISSNVFTNNISSYDYIISNDGILLQNSRYAKVYYPEMKYYATAVTPIQMLLSNSPSTFGDPNNPGNRLNNVYTDTLQIGRLSLQTNPSILNITGPSNDTTTGPHISTYSIDDSYPLTQQLDFTHDNISYNFDSYYDGTWNTSYTGSCYQIYKIGNLFSINGATGTQGTAISWSNLESFDSTGVTQLQYGINNGNSNLNYYQSTTDVTLIMSQSATNIANPATFKLSRVGSQVVMFQTAQYSANGGATAAPISSSGFIPTQFRPLSRVSNIIVVRSNSVYQSGICRVEPNGSIVIFNTVAASTGFPANVINGFDIFTMSWNI